MRIFREKSLLTKLLIMIEILEGKPSKLSQIARSINITPQAVSEYMKDLLKNKLVAVTNGKYKLTKEGVEFLKENLVDMKRFIEESIGRLNIIDRCEAISKEKIEKGDVVNLFMENGYLVAYKSKGSPSTGIALNDAEKEEVLYVGNLKGIVEHRVGIAIAVYSEKDDIDEDKLSEILERERYDKIATRDLRFLLMIKKLGKDINFEFSPISATLDALSRGISVLFCGRKKDVDDLIKEIDKFNRFSVEEIRFRLIEI